MDTATESAAHEALQTGAEINANLERLTFAVTALHGTVLVLALAVGVYILTKGQRNAGTNL